MMPTLKPAIRFKSAVWALLAALAGFNVVGHVPLSLTPAHAQDRGGPVQDDGDAFDQLEQYGDWVKHWRYGRVWVPRDVADDWRPYTRGHWELTGDYGWYWDSSEPWGWATYHYGRWALDDDYGWIWIPGDQWGPAWVDWRQNDEQIGWAPLPPEVAWDGGGLAFGEVDLVSEHYRPAWCFVPFRFFHDRDMRRHIAPASRNVTIINNTSRITNYTVINNTVINRSVDPRRIEQVTHREIRPVRVNLAAQPPQGNAGNGLRVFRPEVRLSARPPSPQAPVLPQGGFKGPAGAPGPGGGVSRLESAPAPSPRGDGDRLRALERRQAEEAQRLQALHARERAQADAARNAEVTRRHQAEQSEMVRIQQQQRAAAQNRVQMPAPRRPPQPPPQPAKPAPQPAKPAPQSAKPAPPKPQVPPGQPPPPQPR